MSSYSETKPWPPSEQAYALLAAHAMKLQVQRDATVHALTIANNLVGEVLAGRAPDFGDESVREHWRTSAQTINSAMRCAQDYDRTTHHQKND